MKILTTICTCFVMLCISCDLPADIGDPNSRLKPYSNEPIQPDKVRKAAWQKFQKENGDEWRISWNEHTGLPASIFLGLSSKKYSGSAQEAAHAFLSEHKSLLGISQLSNLKYGKTQTNRGIRHVTFNQTFKGVPVYEAQYLVHLRSNGQVDMANGTFYPNIEVATVPATSKTEAIHTAQSDLDIARDTKLQTTATLVIYRHKATFHLAWKLTLFSEQPLTDWFYIVDAQSGKILYKRSNIMT